MTQMNLKFGVEIGPELEANFLAGLQESHYQQHSRLQIQLGRLARGTQSAPRFEQLHQIPTEDGERLIYILDKDRTCPRTHIVVNDYVFPNSYDGIGSVSITDYLVVGGDLPVVGRRSSEAAYIRGKSPQPGWWTGNIIELSADDGTTRASVAPGYMYYVPFLRSIPPAWPIDLGESKAGRRWRALWSRIIPKVDFDDREPLERMFTDTEVAKNLATLLGGLNSEGGTLREDVKFISIGDVKRN